MSRAARLQPYLLLAVFVGPLVLAAAAWLFGWSSTATPHGTLLDAPRPLPALTLATGSGPRTSQELFERAWSLTYMPDGPCALDCIEQLNRINQVRLALGKDMGRAQVVLLFTGLEPSLPEGAAVIPVSLDAGSGPIMAAFFAQSTLGDEEIFVVDPLGRLVIAYTSDVEQKGLLEDLERLLAIL